MINLIQQTQAIHSVLKWRISLSEVIQEISETLHQKEIQYGVHVMGFKPTSSTTSLTRAISASTVTSTPSSGSISSSSSSSSTSTSSLRDGDQPEISTLQTSASSITSSYIPPQPPAGPNGPFNVIFSTHSSGTQLPINTYVELERLFIQKQLQQRYLDLMHAYMILEIAFWRKIRRWEIRTCVREYSITMLQLCQQRIQMWSVVEHDIGQHLTNISSVVSPPSLNQLFPNFEGDNNNNNNNNEIRIGNNDEQYQ